MTNVQTIQCEGCGEATPSHDITTYGAIDSGHRQLCSRCFNAEVARLNDLEDFEHFHFEPIGLVDCAGEAHQFHFRTRLLGHIVVLEAFELLNGYPSGYQCEVVGDPEDVRGLPLQCLLPRKADTAQPKGDGRVRPQAVGQAGSCARLISIRKQTCVRGNASR